MDYEKAYKEALERAREYYDVDYDNTLSVRARGIMEHLFPELKESEVEKAAYDYALRVDMGTCGELVVPAFIAGAKWQEKQKEQKPAECVPDSAKFDEGFKTGREIGFREGAESVKPAEWSEEDEKMLKKVIDVVEYYQVNDAYKEDMDWLKSLRPQPHWKPSEEQMKIFNEAIEHYSKHWDSEDIKILCSLYDDLKKL